jgi:hypothetical protein
VLYLECDKGRESSSCQVYIELCYPYVLVIYIYIYIYIKLKNDLLSTLVLE